MNLLQDIVRRDGEKEISLTVDQGTRVNEMTFLFSEVPAVRPSDLWHHSRKLSENGGRRPKRHGRPETRPEHDNVPYQSETPKIFVSKKILSRTVYKRLRDNYLNILPFEPSNP